MGELEQAEAHYRQAIAADPAWSSAWFNLGLLAKRQRRWDLSLEANREALRLDAQSEGAAWNLGIAATAQEDWQEARRAWAVFGVQVPEPSGPFRLNLGLVPIRLDPEGDAEVVWARRICPARAILENVPLPESSHRFGDLVLHDGEPVGARMLNGREVPVFNALQLLARSPLETFEFSVEAPAEPALESLRELVEAREFGFEDWTASVRILCRACSEGLPHAHGEGDEGDEGAGGWERSRRVGVAAPSREAALEVLGTWAAGAPDRSVDEG